MRTPWMVVGGVAFAAMVTACGDNDLRIPDAPNDAFPGLLVRPSEFPHTNCGTHSLDNLLVPSVYTSRYDLNLRIADGDDRADGIATYMFSDDVETPHLLTQRDLLIRTEYDYVYPRGETARVLYAYNICGVDDDGTLHGSVGMATAYPNLPAGIPDPGLVPVFTDEINPPLRRIAGEQLTDHFSLLGETHGTWSGATSLDVKVDGDIAYLANGLDGLRLISIADPSDPVELGHYASGTDYANDVAVVHAAGRTYAVLADDIGRIIDVTNPANPIEVAELDVVPHTVALDGARAYFATGSDGIVPVYDLGDPTHPIKLGEWNGQVNAPDGDVRYHDVFVDTGIAYLSAFSGQGLDVVDFTDPAAPVDVALQMEQDDAYWHCPWASTLGTRKLAFDGDEATGIGLRIYDNDATLASAQPLSTWKLRDDHVSIHNVMVFGSRVYMTHYQDGVRVLDISVPEAPRQIGYYNTWIEGSSPGQYFAGALGLDVDLARKRIYVADLSRGLMILQGDDTTFPE